MTPAVRRGSLQKRCSPLRLTRRSAQAGAPVVSPWSRASCCSNAAAVGVPGWTSPARRRRGASRRCAGAGGWGCSAGRRPCRRAVAWPPEQVESRLRGPKAPAAGGRTRLRLCADRGHRDRAGSCFEGGAVQPLQQHRIENGGCPAATRRVRTAATTRVSQRSGPPVQDFQLWNATAAGPWRGAVSPRLSQRRAGDGSLKREAAVVRRAQVRDGQLRAPATAFLRKAQR